MAVKHGDCRIGELLDSHKTQAQIFGCHSMKSYLMRSQQSTTRVVHHMSEAGLPSTTPVHHAVHHACQQVREARWFYRTCFNCRGVQVNLSSIALLQFPSKDVLSQLQTMEFNWVNYHVAIGRSSRRRTTTYIRRRGLQDWWIAWLAQDPTQDQSSNFGFSQLEKLSDEVPAESGVKNFQILRRSSTPQFVFSSRALSMILHTLVHQP